jgi:hypothetical protein
MIERRPFNPLAAADHGWLKARHHFSDGKIARPESVGCAAGMNDDEITPQTRASASSSREHGNHRLCPPGCHQAQDSLGNEGRIETGHVSPLSRTPKEPYPSRRFAAVEAIDCSQCPVGRLQAAANRLLVSSRFARGRPSGFGWN